MFPKQISGTCLMLLCGMVLSCEQPTDPAPQAATGEDVPETAEEPEPASEPEPAPEPQEEPLQEPEPVEEPEEPAEPEPSPWLAGWIYLVDAEDTVHYSHEEPSAQLTAAYYDMAAKWNRQERDGYPFRVIEG